MLYKKIRQYKVKNKKQYFRNCKKDRVKKRKKKERKIDKT